MKRPLRPPKYLNEVLQAIYELKEIGGSSSSKIVSRVTEVVSDKSAYARPRNITVQVQRALKHALETGVVKQRGGKFRINISKVQHIIDPLKNADKSRKGRRMRKKSNKQMKKRRRRRRRVRAHASHYRNYKKYLGFTSDNDNQDDTNDDYDDEDDYRIDYNIPLRESRRRRRRKRHGDKKKRRDRRRRRSPARRRIDEGDYGEDTKFEKNSDHSNSEHNHCNNSDNDETPKNAYSNDHDSDQAENNHSGPECDNPNCLCNIKKEADDSLNFEENYKNKNFNNDVNLDGNLDNQCNDNNSMNE